MKLYNRIGRTSLFWMLFALYMLPSILVGTFFSYEEYVSDSLKRIILSYEIYVAAIFVFSIYPVLEENIKSIDLGFVIPIVFSLMAAGAALYMLNMVQWQSLSMWLAIATLHMFGITMLRVTFFPSRVEERLA